MEKQRWGSASSGERSGGGCTGAVSPVRTPMHFLKPYMVLISWENVTREPDGAVRYCFKRGE